MDIDEPSGSSKKRESACAQASGSLTGIWKIVQSIPCTDDSIKLMVSDQATEAQAFFDVTAGRVQKNRSSFAPRVRLQKSSETISGSDCYSALGQDDRPFGHAIHREAFDYIGHGHSGARRQVQIVIHCRGYKAKRHWILNVYGVPVDRIGRTLGRKQATCEGQYHRQREKRRNPGKHGFLLGK
jgi:hypothetical protein